MSKDTELFAGDQPAPTAAPVADPAPAAAPVPVAQPVIPASVADLIGPGKKYATVEAALDSIPNAQNHINTLEGENAEFQAKLMSNDKLDQVLARLDTSPAPAAEPTAQPSGISREDLSQLVQHEIASTAKVNLEEANLVDVKTKLQATYGDSASEKWNTKAAEAGMTTAQLTALAKVAPQAVLKLIGDIKSTAPAPTPTSEGVNLGTVGDIGDPAPKKNIMYGASTKDLVNEWNASAVTEE